MLNNLVLKPAFYCPRCEVEFEARDMRILAKRDGDEPAILAWVRCGGCEMALCATVTLQMGGTVSYGIATDCGVDEMRSFCNGEPVSADDVLDVRALLGGAGLFQRLRNEL